MKTLTALTSLLLLCLLIPMTGCKKTPETTPRYDKNACLICNHFGHPEEAGKCFYCKGSTSCGFCNGTGKRELGTKDRYYTEICSFCNGTGKCHYCEGTGKCKTCGGTGKYALPKNSSESAPAPSPASEAPVK